MRENVATEVEVAELFDQYAERVEQIKAEIAKVVIGQEEMITLMIHTLLSRGHILLEGVPGLAKSLAVETFAKVIGGNFKRFQFTPDKMPSDITGTMVWNEKEKKFEFYYGPIFCNIFLADEINRASPKVQSALLQAMQEKEVTIERKRYDISPPFMVLATQNPIEQIGTYPLAESQVDRFMVKYDVGYPGKDEELELILRKNTDFDQQKAEIRNILSLEEITAMQQLIHDQVRVSQKVMAYILNVCTATRPRETYSPQDLVAEIHQYIRLGASPRASESLLALAKSFAFGQHRDFVNFDDVSACAAHVLRHRILLNSTALSQQIDSDMLVQEILKMVPPY
ncbi:MoxR family ATPase [Geomonas sp. RF6]|uniref:AAA family ATPase n=1 Tax=Geomonas sp. RF6 TaxID=2897342 RepID=UPI001E621BA6|nr:MoxR family ATPase [Geomonas sp. RF6]UFS70947.1 MoxR family ATPase [Geomonas sp. RF6]